MFDTKIGKIFFIGIGGIGMSGIAEVLVNQGFEVAGSDISENLNIVRLRKLGVNVDIGHSEENIYGASIVVISWPLEFFIASEKYDFISLIPYGVSTYFEFATRDIVDMSIFIVSAISFKIIGLILLSSPLKKYFFWKLSIAVIV